MVIMNDYTKRKRPEQYLYGITKLNTPFCKCFLTKWHNFLPIFSKTKHCATHLIIKRNVYNNLLIHFNTHWSILTNLQNIYTITNFKQLQFE